LVNHGALLVPLRKVVAIEIGVAAHGGVRQIDVSEAAVAELVDLVAIVFHPSAQTESTFAGNGNDRNGTGIFSRGILADFELHGLAGGFLEEAEDFVGAQEFATVNGKEIIAFVDIHAGLGKWSVQTRIPVFAVKNVGEAIAAILDFVVSTKQAAADVFHFRAIPAGDVNVLCGDFTEHVSKDVVEIDAGHDVVNERLIGGGKGFQVGAVHIGVVEEI